MGEMPKQPGSGSEVSAATLLDNGEFTAEEAASLAEFRSRQGTTYEAITLREQGLDIRQLKFARWLLEHDKLNER